MPEKHLSLKHIITNDILLLISYKYSGIIDERDVIDGIDKK